MKVNCGESLSNFAFNFNLRPYNVVSSNIVMQFVVMRLSQLPAWRKVFWVPYYAVKCVVYLVVGWCWLTHVSASTE